MINGWWWVVCHVNVHENQHLSYQFPVEAPPGHVRGCDVLEGLVRDDVNDGADDRLPVLGDLGQERLQPALSTLAVGVEEGDDVAFSLFGTMQTSYYDDN